MSRSYTHVQELLPSVLAMKLTILTRWKALQKK